MNKDYLKLSAIRKGGKFVGYWKKNGVNYDGKIAIVLESNFIDLSKHKIEWGYTISNIDTNPDKMGTEIFLPFNLETAEFNGIPQNAFKIKGVFKAGGFVTVTVQIDNDDPVDITLTTESIVKNGVESHQEVYEFEDDDIEPEPEPEPDDDEIPVPDVDPIVEGNMFKQLYEKYKWHGVCYIAGLLTPIVVKILNWIF